MALPKARRTVRTITATRLLTCCGDKKINEQAILIVTKTDGFFVYDVASKGMEHYEASRLPKAPVRSAYMDKYSEIWFEQEVPGTVAHFNAKTKVLKTEVIPVEPTSTDRSRPAFHVHEDIYGTVWVHPYGGGFSRFDRETTVCSLSTTDCQMQTGGSPTRSIRPFPTGRVTCGCARIPKGWRK